MTIRKFAMRAAVGALIGTCALGATPALAQYKVESGTNGNLSWKAESKIVAVDPTATIAGGGSPLYLAQAPKYSGSVGLIMEYANGNAFVCSGSLMNDRHSIVTAGHCVSDGFGTAGPAKVSAYFYNGHPSDPVFYLDLFGQPLGAGVTKMDVGTIFVNSGYTGAVIDQNDIAVLRLTDAAPTWAQSYDLYAGPIDGQQFNVVGYGARSSGGGNVGDDLGTGRRRQAENVYDYALGNSAFNDFFTTTDNTPVASGGCGGVGTNFFCTNADIEFSYISDFDNGLPANNAACLIAGALGAASPAFCTTGVGQMEGAIAGGDSGGGAFINGQLASVNSYGLTFGPNFGDVDGDLNSTFGEFSGYVPISIHTNFIMSSMVPEPATWAQMMLGFGLLGGLMRRRKAKVAVSFA